MNAPQSSLLVMSRLLMVLIVAGFVAAGSLAQEPSAAAEAAQPAADAQAAASPGKIFVASNGKDANSGTRLAPKRTLQAALNAVATDGEIVIVDTAVYGPMDITRGVSVIASPGAHGIINVTGGSNGVTITGPSNFGVILRGLIIEGGGQGQGGNGIFASKALNLVVDDCSIRNFNYGLQQTTPNSSTSLNNSTLLGCYNGFYLFISSGGNASANVNHCRFELNGSVAVDSRNNNTSGSITTTVSDSQIYRNTYGIVATRITGVSVLSNVLVSNCVITDNSSGVLGDGSSSGQGLVLSRGNNTLTNNGGGNAFGGSYSAQ